MDEYDILGHSSLPRRDNPASTISFTLAALTLASILVVYILLQRGWEYVSRWKELNYKLRERRRHGIPDNDKRPFNVAYAAVLLARKEQERQAANKRFEQQLREQRAQQDSNRQQARPGTFLPVTQPYTPNRVTFADAYNTNPPSPATVYPNDRRQVVSILKKRALDDEDLAGADYKKSRVEPVEVHEQVPYPSTSKRQPTDDSDLVPDRKASDSTLNEDMDVDDQIIELSTTNRGKKRDRTEGGDYEEEDKSRRTKRRNKRRSDVGVDPRGKKRDRDPESSDQSDDEREAKSRKKRGKKSQPLIEEEESASDVSMDDSTPSKSRKAGDEWESNGIWYKLGRDGQRLQKVLMRESHKKYSMPQDSMHPDRDGRIEICMWAWLTEDELKEAKARGLLSHQDSPKIEEDETSVPPQTLVQLPVQPPEKQTPQKTGKHLLWESTGPSVRSMQENPFSSSLNKSPVKIKPESMFASPRRLAGLTDSTNGSLRQYRQYSKWEKQDLEAKAMMRVREASRKQQEDAAREKAEKEKAEKEKAIAAIPTISLTKPAEDLSKKPMTLSSAPSLSSGDSSGNLQAPKPESSPFTSPSTSKPIFFAPTASSSAGKSEAKPSTPAFSATPQPTSNLFAPKPADKPTLQSAGFPSSFPQTAPASTVNTPLAPPSTEAAKQASAFQPVAANAAPSQPPAFPPPALPASAPPAPSTSASSTSAPRFSFSIPGKPVTDQGPTPSLFSNVSKTNAPEAPKPTISSAPTNSQAAFALAAPTGVPAATSTQGSGLKFSFLPPQSTAATSGGFPSTTTPATTTASTVTTAPKPTFSFNPKPAENAATTSSPFSLNKPAETTPSSFPLNKPAESAATAASSAFPFTAKPAAAPTAAPSSAPATSAFSFGAKSAEPATTSAFSFAPKPAAQPATTPTTNATSTSTPAASEGSKFKFGGPSVPSFGPSTTTSAFVVPTQDAAKTTTPFGTPATAFGQDATKTTTTLFGTPSTPTNIFGAKTDAAKPPENPFVIKPDSTASSSSMTKNVFGTAASAFGTSGFKFGDASNNKSEEGKEKSAFVFGTPAPSGSSTSTTEPAKTGLFGTSTTSQTSTFGGFGGENKTTAFGGFGSQPSSNIFGSTSNSGSQ